jgi:hypothetical protein
MSMPGKSSNKVTDYLEISKKIAAFTKDHPKTYNECVNALLEISATHFPPLYHQTSPIIANLDEWGADDLAFVIKEYSGWLNETIHMFLDARIRIYWDGVRKEIERNVGEEMGMLTNNVPHLELMRQGYSRDLGIETDNITYSAITGEFISKMRSVFKHKDNAFLAGALLAFESIATEEFKIVNSLLRKRKSLIGGDIKRGSLTDIYIAGHVIHAGEGVHPEDLHYEGLRYAIEPYINSKNIHRFIKGFFSVCLNMSIWWERLVVETYYQNICQDDLMVYDIEVVDIFQALKARPVQT